MVNIVSGIATIINHDDMPNYFYNIFVGQRPLLSGNVQAQPLIKLITPYPPQVIMKGIKEQVIYQFLGIFHIRWVIRT